MTAGISCLAINRVMVECSKVGPLEPRKYCPEKTHTLARAPPPHPPRPCQARVKGWVGGREEAEELKRDNSSGAGGGGVWGSRRIAQCPLASCRNSMSGSERPPEETLSLANQAIDIQPLRATLNPTTVALRGEISLTLFLI